jgi:hypothetical protein
MLSSRLASPAFAVLLLVSCVFPSRAVEPDKLLPSDADSVAFVNVRQTTESALVKKYGLPLLKDAVASNPDLQNLAMATGLDVTRDLDSVLLATAGGVDGKLLVVVRGKFDVPKFEAALADVAKNKPKELKITKEGATTIYELTAEGKTTCAAFADARTIVASPDRAYLVAALKRKDAPAAPRQELAAVLKKFSGKESLYLVMVVTPEVKKSLEANDQTKELAKVLKEVSAAVTVADDVRIDATATTTNPTSALQLVNFVNTIRNALPGLVKVAGNEQLLPLAEAVQKNTKVANQGNSAGLSLKLPEDVIKKALGAGAK